MLCYGLQFKLRQLWVVLFALCLTGCSTTPAVPPQQFDRFPDAISVPYRLSQAGHLILDISVNGSLAQPFIVDSGANVSAVYENHGEALGLVATNKAVSVNGLVATQDRPTVENVTFQIGTQRFDPDRVVFLNAGEVDNEAVGLLGTDVLADYTIIFDKERQLATLFPSQHVESSSFSGWKKISLRNKIGSMSDNGLYFAQVNLAGHKSSVLIDIGSELNVVNWHLATLDEEMLRAKKRLQRELNFQGSVGTFPVRLQTSFFDLKIGDKHWPETDVIIMEFDALTTVAPVDRPMMVAGASMFTPWSFAFDFQGNAIYIYEP